MTIHSSIDLSKTLLQEYKFDYVFTGRINQDLLEVSMKNKIILIVQQVKGNIQQFRASNSLILLRQCTK